MKHQLSETEGSKHYEFYQDDQILIIGNVNREIDQGVYSCLARNEVNRIETQFKLRVIPPSKIETRE